MSKLLASILVCALMMSISNEIFAEEITVVGIIEVDAEGTIIKAADGNYKIAGKDLTAMAGKNVAVTGTVTEDTGIKTITVTSVQDAQ
ncbi:MAG: hypothetical protein HQK77_04640 [Desulfobacterales bacterium]|nr:hypothetical protein [Desulfobacterales bacterium]